MGSMWIFLLCVGVAAIMKGKSILSEDKSVPQSPPTDSEREEIERRIREIMGMPEVQKRVVSPVESPIRQAQPTTSTVQPSRTMSSVYQRSQSPKPSVSSRKQTAKVANLENSPKTVHSSSQQTIAASSPVETVMDDFSLEKAVIYAEILQPKFKEY
ncbi:MAG: hypothetical protein J6Q31_01665 [Alistipes sp.]|nr:hypothetical protein [Alistipes sp.]